MEGLKLQILKDYGRLSLNGYMYLRLSEFDGNTLYEVRGWRQNGEVPFDTCVKFTLSELKTLYSLLTIALNTPKATVPIRKLRHGDSVIKIYNYFGDISSQGVTLQFTYTDWGEYALKYDLRHWVGNFDDCWTGVRLTHAECFGLIKVLEKEFGFAKQKKHG